MNRFTEVPSLKGLTIEQATRALEEAGLEAVVEPTEAGGWYTYAALVAHIRRSRGKRFFVYVEHSAKLKSTQDAPWDFRYQATAHIPVTKGAVLQFLRNAYVGSFRERVRIAVLETAHFIYLRSGRTLE